MLFRPCLHLVACDSCSSLMKKCVQCRAPIETAVPLSVASGGRRESVCVCVCVGGGGGEVSE